jgi:hypothetical protein
MGNKIIADPESGKQTIVLADGMDEEFQIAHELGLKLIPIGASGYKAKELFNQITSDFDQYYPNSTQKFREAFEKLNEEVDEPNKLLSKIHDVIKLI